MTIIGIIAVAVVSFLLGYWVKIDIYRDKVLAVRKEMRNMETMYAREIDTCRRELKEINITLHGYKSERNEHNGKV